MNLMLTFLHLLAHIFFLLNEIPCHLLILLSPCILNILPDLVFVLEGSLRFGLDILYLTL